MNGRSEGETGKARNASEPLDAEQMAWAPSGTSHVACCMDQLRANVSSTYEVAVLHRIRDAYCGRKPHLDERTSNVALGRSLACGPGARTELTLAAA